ncbi:MAG TPA: right-handed parallel beta-helix repeat-containing protein [Bryobacteraceae bacterium]|nr:right-handed parallel beta-helix repeat-containing protein [Bryobacteraceae bacterium]
MTAAFGKSIIASLAFALSLAQARVMTLRPGVTVVSSEIVVKDGDTLRGAKAGSTLRASRRFKGRAVVVAGSGATVERLTIDGNRAALATPLPIAPFDRTFVSYYANNGIVSANTRDVVIRDVRLVNVSNFAVLISGSSNVRLEGIQITNSGSLDAKGKNNTTGGILIEEGSSDFVVKDCVITNVPGNGVWTHSLYTSKRNARGEIASNRFSTIGRDAIQIGHATEVRVHHNIGTRIGFPQRAVDIDGGGIPVAIDTAGNVDKTTYANNTFTELNGKCIDLDGFHNGVVRENSCTNKLSAAAYPSGHYGIVFNNTNPDMQSENIEVAGNVIDGAKFGGIFVIGRGHTIRNNRLLRLNLAGCNESHLKFGCLYNAEEPDILQTGIYLGKGAERPAVAEGNTIVDNVVSGFKMDRRCIAAAVGVDLTHNTIERNECRNR